MNKKNKIYKKYKYFSSFQKLCQYIYKAITFTKLLKKEIFVFFINFVFFLFMYIHVI